MNFDDEEKQKLIEEVHAGRCFPPWYLADAFLPVVTVRDAKHTNFVEFRNFKIVYRRYAGLYFCICVDVSDNNLYYLEVRLLRRLTLLPSGHPQLCRGSQRILPQCLRARSGVQLLQGGSAEVLGVRMGPH